MTDTRSSTDLAGLRQLAEELREYTAMKYAGDCKCGKCQLVPRPLVERLYHTLNSYGGVAQGAGNSGVSDATVERAWAAIVGRDIAAQCFQASIIRADLRSALEAVMRDVAYAPTESDADKLREHLQEMVDMVAPTIKSEHRISQGLSSALIRSRQLLTSLSVSSTEGK